MDDALYDLRFSIDQSEWRARGRRELICRLWERYRGSSTPATLLDVGCGTGVLVQELGRYGIAWGVDPSAKAVAFCRRRGLQTVKEAGGDALPFPDNEFNLVTAIDVIEHIRDDAAALREMVRVMAPNGLLIVIVPAFDFLWSDRDERLHHFRRYRLPTLRDRIREAGLAIVQSSYVDAFLFPPLYLLVRFGRQRNGASRVPIDSVLPPAPINTALTWWMRLETAWLLRRGLPVGVSALVVGRKQVPA